MIYYNNKLRIKYYDINELKGMLNMFSPEVVGRGKHKYINLASGYDIETTSFEDNDIKLAEMYHFQFGFTDPIQKNKTFCFKGNTEEELLKMLSILSEYAYSIDKKAKLLIYVHNLSFEYFFLRGLIDFDDYFVTKTNTILYAIYKNIEFRCSYLLSGCGLAMLPTYIPNSKNLNKLCGDLDYSVFRTPENCNLTDTEEAYCLQDVRIVCAYIQSQINRYGDISKIPLTKTSGITREMKEYCMPKGKDTLSIIEKKRFIREISQLKFHSGAEFIMATKAFAGGHTTANPAECDKILEDIFAYDYLSSYPSVCCYSYEFPKSYIDYYSDKDESFLINEKNLNHAYIALITLTDVRPARYLRSNDEEFQAIFDSFIPSCKCEVLENAELTSNSGYVLSADKLQIYITNLDYETLCDFYDFNVHVEYIATYNKGYLPRKVISFILERYKKKTELKDIEERKLEYNIEKEVLNSCSYGVHVKSPLKDVMKYNEEEEKWQATFNDEWLEDFYDFTTAEGHKQYYNDKATNYNKRLYSGQIIIPYVAAIFITSIAKRNIAKAIFAAGCDKQHIYSDTDSLYTKGAFTKYINSYNNSVKQQFELMCSFYNFPEDIWRPKNIDGIEQPLGYFALDGHYKYMKVLRPKTYITIDYNDELHTIIAGLGKDEGREFLASFDDTHEYYEDKKGKHYIIHDYKKVFDAFKIGMVVPADKTGKLTHTIFRKEYKGNYNGHEYHLKGGVHLAPNSFEIKYDKEWDKLIKMMIDGYDDIYYE